MSAKLTALLEERNKILTQYQEIRDKYKGTRTEIPSEDEERLAKLWFEYEGFERDIAVEEAQANRAALKANFDQFRFVGPRDPQQARQQDQLAALRQVLNCRDSAAYQAAVTRLNQVDLGVQGGYISLPEVVLDDLIVEAKKEFVARRICRYYGRISRSGGGIPRQTNRATCTRTGETGTPPVDTITFGKFTLKPKDYSNQAIISRPEIRESNAESVVLTELVYARGDMEEQEFFTGDGVNKWLGVLTVSPDGISANRNQNSITAGTVKPDDLWNLCLKKVKPRYYQRGRWIVSQGGLAACRTMKDGAGNFVWNPMGNIADAMVGGNPGLLCGKPYDVSEYMPDVATGNIPFIFGDFTRYGIVDGLEEDIQVLYEKYADINCNGYIQRGGSDGAPMLDEAFGRLVIQ